MNLGQETKSLLGFGYVGIIICLIVYVYLFIQRQKDFFQALFVFIDTIEKLFLTLILVFIILVIFNFFIDEKNIAKWFHHKNIKAWVYVIIGGIISIGPLYLWYPVLSDAIKKGVSFGLISTFIYVRAIKPALLPLMIVYFGLSFTILITVLVIIGSVILGLITDFFMVNSKSSLR